MSCSSKSWQLRRESKKADGVRLLHGRELTRRALLKVSRARPGEVQGASEMTNQGAKAGEGTSEAREGLIN